MIKVGLVGYGTIGKRVADAITAQKDMELVGITGHSYDFKIEVAKIKGFRIFIIGDEEEFVKNGIKPEGDINNLLEEADVIVDCTPKKVGRDNKEKYYLPKEIKAIFQGGEKPDVAEASFVAQ